MKLVSYDAGRAPRAGLWLDGWVADLEKGARATGQFKLPADVRELLAAGGAATAGAGRTAKKLERLTRDLSAGKGRRPAWLYPADALHLCAPVLNPGKIICLGMNYSDHVREQEKRAGQKMDIPKTPVLFAKYPSALNGPYDPIRLPPLKVAAQVDYEVELAIVIGTTAKGVSRQEALKHVAGYMIANDVSARDCQFVDKQWVRAKSFDSFAPCGPWLATSDEIPDPQRLKIWTLLNGRTMQSGNTRDQVHKIPATIAFIAQAITLFPGDIILTGTPAGVGIFRDPPVVLQPGDVVECGIEGIGSIRNAVVRGAAKKPGEGKKGNRE